MWCYKCSSWSYERKVNPRFWRNQDYSDYLVVSFPQSRSSWKEAVLVELTLLFIYEGNCDDSSLCMQHGGSQLQKLGLVEPSNVVYQNPCHGDSDKIERDLWNSFVSVGKGVFGWKIIPHPQGCADAFELY